jgi:hypothetical protein
MSENLEKSGPSWPNGSARHRGRINPDRWIRILLRNRTVAFVPTDDWEGTVSWWLREKSARKCAEGIVWGEVFPVHLNNLATGDGFIDQSGPWIISKPYDVKRWQWGRA